MNNVVLSEEEKDLLVLTMKRFEAMNDYIKTIEPLLGDCLIEQEVYKKLKIKLGCNDEK